MPTISITAQHINNAARFQQTDDQTELCPVRLAFCDACGFDILVGSDTFEAIDGFAEVEIPEHVKAFIYDFDCWALDQPRLRISDCMNLVPTDFELSPADVAQLSGRKP